MEVCLITRVSLRKNLRTRYALLPLRTVLILEKYLLWKLEVTR